MNKNKKIMCHSLKSLISNARGYLRIFSVVIVTFTIVLIVLGYRDSIFFQEHKEIKLLPRNVVELKLNTEQMKLPHYKNFISSVKRLDDIEYTSYFFSSSSSSSNYYQNSIGGYLSFQLYYVDEAFFNLPVSLGESYQQIKIKEGRGITSHDIYREKCVVINEITASLLFPNESAVGKTIYVCKNNASEEKYTVVGVTYATQKDKKDYQNYLDTNFYVTSIYVSKNDMIKSSIIDNCVINFKTSKTQEVLDLRDTFQISSLLISNTQHQLFIRKEHENFVSNVIVLFVISIIMVINIQGIFKTVLYTRRKELGIRRSLGATRFNIFLQLLIECMVVLIICILVSFVLSVHLLNLIIFLLKDTYMDMKIYFSSYTLVSFFGMAFLQCISLSMSTALSAANVDIIKLLNQE